LRGAAVCAEACSGGASSTAELATKERLVSIGNAVIAYGAASNEVRGIRCLSRKCPPSKIPSRVSAANPCQARNSPSFGESSCLARICPCAKPQRVRPFSFPSLPASGPPNRVEKPVDSGFHGVSRAERPSQQGRKTGPANGNAGDLVAGRPVQPPALPTTRFS